MGTLGEFLIGAREAKGLDLHDAAQQTRISIYYLKALEEEDFSKLPGEVFVKGFLKSYARFLAIPEEEIIRRYQEVRPRRQTAETGPEVEQPQQVFERIAPKRTPLEPILWGAVLVIALVAFLFTALPQKKAGTSHVPAPIASQPSPTPAETMTAPKPVKFDKLYLEVTAVEDTWLLVRTDSSPQKKSILKKGDVMIWSADERFLLSFGSLGAVTLRLNGEPLTLTGPSSAVVRDLMITASGIVRPLVPEPPKVVKPKPKPQPPAVEQRPAETPAQPAAPAPVSPPPVQQQEPTPAPPRTEQPPAAPPPSAPSAQDEQPR